METIRVWIKSWSDSQDLARPVARLDENDILPIMLRHCTPCHAQRRQDAVWI